MQTPSFQCKLKFLCENLRGAGLMGKVRGRVRVGEIPIVSDDRYRQHFTLTAALSLSLEENRRPYGAGPMV